MTNDLLRRVTDLFIEGKVLVLEDGLQLWIQKPNSFEVEEARRDGVAARGLRMIALADPESAELKGQRFEVERLDESELRRARVGQRGEQLWISVMDDMEADPEWVEKLAIMRRMPTLLHEEGASEGDPRRKQLADMNIAYLQRTQELLAKAERDALRDLEDVTRAELEADYYEAWRQRITLDLFMAERTVTEIFYATRVCKAVKAGQGWNHSACDHQLKLLNDRSEVRILPDALTDRIRETLNEIVVPDRESGNSAAPRSSSVSSEQASTPEATSAASTPTETPVGAPTT